MTLMMSSLKMNGGIHGAETSFSVIKTMTGEFWCMQLEETSDGYSDAVIYIDGTFKTCPAPYSQFVTVHGNFHGRVRLSLLSCVSWLARLWHSTDNYCST